MTFEETRVEKRLERRVEDSQARKSFAFWRPSAVIRIPPLWGDPIYTAFFRLQGDSLGIPTTEAIRKPAKNPYFWGGSRFFQGLRIGRFWGILGYRKRLYFSQGRRFYPQPGRRIKLHRWSGSRRMNLLGGCRFSISLTSVINK